jgi:hypothetical protein
MARAPPTDAEEYSCRRYSARIRNASGFAREALMAWCEAHRVDFVFGLARNPRLVEELAIDLAWAEEEAIGEDGRALPA